MLNTVLLRTIIDITEVTGISIVKYSVCINRKCTNERLERRNRCEKRRIDSENGIKQKERIVVNNIDCTNT